MVSAGGRFPDGTVHVHARGITHTHCAPRRGGNRLIIGRWPQVRVIAVTSFLEEEKVRAALDVGASGYLVKDATADDVADAVRVVAAGKFALQPSVTRTLIDAVRPTATIGAS